MKKTFFIYPVILIIGVFLGYENPEIITKSKKIYKYFFGKEEVIEKKQLQVFKKENFIEANSFELFYEKIMTFEDRSASMIISSKNGERLINLYTNNGKIETTDKIKEIKLPIDFFSEKNGGIRSVFEIDGSEFLLISNKILNCYYASIFRVVDNQQIIKSKCIPDEERIDFSGLGGGYVNYGDKILIAIGTPTHSSKLIDKLSQDDAYMFGKVLEIKKNDLLDTNLEKVNFNIFSSGHRNPQGLVKIDDKIYSLEHGPHGGDELNLVIKGNNYGWPIYSYGVPYEKNTKLLHHDEKRKYISPIYIYMPAVAPSHIVNCPNNLKEYYNENICLLGLSLRGMSLLLILLEKNGEKVISSEKINFEERLRHFGLNNQMQLYQDSDNSFYVASDGNNIYKFKFKNFVK